MDKAKAKVIIYYGVFLILAGVVGYLSNPEKAKTALLSGGTFGSLSILWGVLALRQVAWGLTAAKVTTVFLSVVFLWRAWVTWAKALTESPEKMFAACLITAMLLASWLLLKVLMRKE